MPQPFRRRRRPGTGPNKNELKVRRRERAEVPAGQADGALADLLPGVAGVSIEMEFLNVARQRIGQEQRDFAAGDSPSFTVECPGRCRFIGVFDLGPRVKQVVASGRKSLQSSDLCPERIFPQSAETCGCQLLARIDVSYGASA